MAKMNWTSDMIPDVSDKTVIVTGSTSGIGKEAVRVLAQKNARIIMAVRNTQKGEQVVKEFGSLSNIFVRELDLSSLKSVKAFADNYIKEFGTVNVLINNAGVMMCPFGTTEDGFELQIGTNHFGHYALTGLLYPILKKSPNSRIVNVSSLAHFYGKIDFDDIHWDKRKYSKSGAYGASKLANMLFTYELDRRIKNDTKANGLKVLAVHPGWTATDLQRHSGVFDFFNPFLAMDVSMGALPTLRAGFDPEAKSGDFIGPKNFWHWRGYPVKQKSSKLSYNKEKAEALWKISEQSTGIIFD